MHNVQRFCPFLLYRALAWHGVEYAKTGKVGMKYLTNNEGPAYSKVLMSNESSHLICFIGTIQSSNKGHWRQ